MHFWELVLRLHFLALSVALLHFEIAVPLSSSAFRFEFSSGFASGRLTLEEICPSLFILIVLPRNSFSLELAEVALKSLGLKLLRLNLFPEIWMLFKEKELISVDSWLSSWHNS